MIQNVLKTNVRVCTSMRSKFLPQLSKIYVAALSVYKAYSEMISAAVASQGQQIAVTSNIKSMRGVRKEVRLPHIYMLANRVRCQVLRLVQAFVEHCDDPRTVCEHFVPPLMEPVLGDYQRSVASCREAVVLSLMATLISKLKSAVRDKVHIDMLLACSAEVASME